MRLFHENAGTCSLVIHVRSEPKLREMLFFDPTNSAVLSPLSVQVFSANEEVGEIATPMMPLLAVDFYLGSLMIKLPFTSPQVSRQIHILVHE